MKIFLLFFSFIITVATNVQALEQCSYFITSGSTSLSYYKIAKKISAASGEIICPLESYGSLENLHNIFQRDDVIAALVQEDVLLAASRQNPDKLNDLRMGLPIQKEVAHLIVKNDSPYTKIGELGDGVVCVGKPSSGSYFTSLQVKALSNTPWVDAREEFPKCLELLDRGSVDAVFTLSLAPIKLLEGKIGNSLRLIPIPKIHGYESSSIVEYNTEKKSTAAINTIAVDTFLVIAESRVKKKSRLSNKLSMGIAAIIGDLDIINQDSVCTNQFESFGMVLSEHQRQACKLGFFGADW
jgi:TRAP-type uncharacterized transport system substrate-binding protein